MAGRDNKNSTIEMQSEVDLRKIVFNNVSEIICPLVEPK